MGFLKKNKQFSLMFIFLALFCGATLFAGTTDNLGLAGTYSKVISFLTDAYLQKMIGAIFIILILTMLTRSEMKIAMILGFVYLVYLSLSTIVDKFVSAVM